MKNNLISGIASWKSAALLAIVAVVAAVAFSGVLTNTHTAEAANVPLAENVGATTGAPGDTVQIVVNGALAQVNITGTADGVGGSFVANGGQSINCADGTSCDSDDSDANTPGKQNAADQVRVDLKIDADAGEGYILVSVTGVGADTNTATVTKVITVSKAALVGSLSLKATAKTIAANDDNTNGGDGGPNETTLVVNVKNAATSPAGVNGQSVTLFTTLGTISCDGTNYAQACSGDTADSASTPGVETDGTPGYLTVQLRGGGVEGVATITATLGSLKQTVDVTMYGTAKNLTATPQQGSIEIGGSVFVVLKVTDGAGNPVSGQVITPAAAKEVVGPTDDAVLVVTAKDATADNAADGSGYNMDLIAATGNIPACGDDKDPVTDTSATPPTTEDFTSNGTDVSGQCVVHVTAPEAVAGDPTTKDATRGAHTLNFSISAAITASATIEVAGKPNSISTDAPPSVDPASVTKVTVSVFDDEEVLVGITDVINIRKVGGDGLVEDAGTGTMNGQTTFTFIAPSTAGSAEVLITAGDVNHRVTINIGEAPAEEAATWNKPLASGTHNLVWVGEDGADPADAGDVVAIWQWTGSGWVGYFSAAGDVGLANTLTELNNGEAYWVVVE
ncbi:MAG: hypothetical protein F4086_04275 [Gemmatimonadetes bacterium]|nr:hypothetical protein [Gemmatimonadota bacterium]